MKRSFDEAVSILESRPNDLFLHRYLLYKISEWEPEGLREYILNWYKKDCFRLLALAYEACIINSKFQSLTAEFRPSDIPEFPEHTPLIYIPWSLGKAHLCSSVNLQHPCKWTVTGSVKPLSA